MVVIDTVCPSLRHDRDRWWNSIGEAAAIHFILIYYYFRAYDFCAWSVWWPAFIAAWSGVTWARRPAIATVFHQQVATESHPRHPFTAPLQPPVTLRHQTTAPQSITKTMTRYVQFISSYRLIRLIVVCRAHTQISLIQWAESIIIKRISNSQFWQAQCNQLILTNKKQTKEKTKRRDTLIGVDFIGRLYTQATFTIR